MSDNLVLDLLEYKDEFAYLTILLGRVKAADCLDYSLGHIFRACSGTFSYHEIPAKTFFC